VRPRGAHDERAGHRPHLDEREPQDPLTGAPMAVVEAGASDAVPVRHLAHRILEALS
jgi:hypothetical protein